MNFSDILAALNRASAFELYRLRAAIDRVLDQPGWLDAVRAQIQVGQNVDYFDPSTNRSHRGQILELRRKQAVIRDLATDQRWLIPYAAINLDGTDVAIRERPREGLGRNELAIGEIVGFTDRHQQERSGQIIRLNDRTVTLACGHQQWRVSYSLLHRVVDSEALNGEALQLGVVDEREENRSSERHA